MIRLAKISDINSIIELLKDVLLIHHNIRPDLFKEKGYKYDKDGLIKLMSKDNYKIFVYEENNKVLGYIFIEIKENLESFSTNYNKEIYIDDLCVDEKYRGKNIGKELVLYVKEYAKEINANYITLHVYKGNLASDFYEKLGFIERYKSLEIKL